MKRELIVLIASMMALAGCGPGEVRAVEIYPEDMCAACRMAISDERFASEIIEVDGTVHKFDDLGCFFEFREKRQEMKVAASFLKDYETSSWIPYEKSAIVETGIWTPMASGKVAFASSERASAFVKAHPPEESAGRCCTQGSH